MALAPLVSTKLRNIRICLDCFQRKMTSVAEYVQMTLHQLTALQTIACSVRPQRQVGWLQLPMTFPMPLRRSSPTEDVMDAMRDSNICRERGWWMRKYANTMKVRELSAWLMENVEGLSSMAAAQDYLAQLRRLGYLTPLGAASNVPRVTVPASTNTLLISPSSSSTSPHSHPISIPNTALDSSYTNSTSSVSSFPISPSLFSSLQSSSPSSSLSDSFLESTLGARNRSNTSPTPLVSTTAATMNISTVNVTLTAATTPGAVNGSGSLPTPSTLTTTSESPPSSPSPPLPTTSVPLINDSTVLQMIQPSVDKDIQWNRSKYVLCHGIETVFAKLWHMDGEDVNNRRYLTCNLCIQKFEDQFSVSHSLCSL
jgi:hypothetical protein